MTNYFYLFMRVVGGGVNDLCQVENYCWVFFLTDIKKSLSGLRGYHRKGVERADRQN